MSSPSPDPSEETIGRDGGRLEAAEYICHAVAELSELARAHKLGMLAYLLDMAKLEAEETLRHARNVSPTS